MDKLKALILYLTGTLGQIGLVCTVVYLLRNLAMEMGYQSIAGFVAIAIGGTSSAIWGTVVCKKYREKSIKTVIKDFFNIRQSIKSYSLLFFFIVLDFAYLLVGGKLNISIWYIPFVLFFKAIIFIYISEII